MISYGGLPEEYTRYDSSDIVIIPVPYDKTSTWIKGADNGPGALLEASENMELYDIETDSEVFKKGIHTLKPLISGEQPEILSSMVKNALDQILSDKKFPVIIGGEHSVSIGAFQSFSNKFKELTILQLDAHSDRRESYDGSSFNHACVMSRASELAPVVQVGIRSMCSEEKKKTDNKRTFYAHDILSGNEWIEQLIPLLTKNVYITIDLDVFDPSLMPSTGTPEPGGLTYNQVTNLLRKVNLHSNIVGFDIVELCPKESNKAPDFLASKLLYQILSYKFYDKKKSKNIK